MTGGEGGTLREFCIKKVKIFTEHKNHCSKKFVVCRQLSVVQHLQVIMYFSQHLPLISKEQLFKN